MRIIQRILFFLGLAAFLTALGYLSDQTGEMLFRVGVACMITSIAFCLAWPAKPAKNEG